MSVLTKQRIAVSTENDIVVLSVGRAAARFSYGAAAAIAQGLRIGANVAGRHERIPQAERQELRHPEPATEPAPLHGYYRRSKERSGMRWRVDVEGALVRLVIGDTTLTFESPTAFQVAGWLRERARVAKRWAGDRSKTLRAAGHLSDAEENYRTGAH